MNTKTDTAVERVLALSNMAPEALASSLADKFNGNKDAVEYTEDTLVAFEKSKRGAVPLLLDYLLPTYGNDLAEAGFPVPDSDTGNGVTQADHCTVQRPGVNNSTRNVKTTIIALIAEDLTPCIEARKIIEAVNLAGKADTNGKAPLPYRDMTTEALEAAKKAAEARKTNTRRLLRTAVKVFYKGREIETRLAERVNFGFVYNDGPKDADGNVTNVLTASPNCIYISDPKQPTKAKAMTAAQFVNLDVGECLAKGGTYSALLGTLSRELGAGQGGTDASKPAKTIKNVGQFVEYAAEQAQYLGGDDTNGKRSSVIVAECRKDVHTLLSVGRLITRLDDGVWNEIQADYFAAEKAHAAALKAEADAKAKLAA